MTAAPYIFLVAADTTKDNRNDNDIKRRFMVAERMTLTRIDEQGDAYAEDLVAVEEIDGPTPAAGARPAAKELIIRFEYKATPPGTKQDALAAEAVQTVLAHAVVKTRWLVLVNAPLPKRTSSATCWKNT